MHDRPQENGVVASFCDEECALEKPVALDVVAVAMEAVHFYNARVHRFDGVRVEVPLAFLLGAEAT